jgi:hypothetical protein
LRGNTQRPYAELQRIARAHLRREAPGHTLQTTALVHEAYLRLLGQRAVDWHDRAHFFALASTMKQPAAQTPSRAPPVDRWRPRGRR